LAGLRETADAEVPLKQSASQTRTEPSPSRGAPAFAEDLARAVERAAKIGDELGEAQ
jgi:hypothetical protein